MSYLKAIFIFLFYLVYSKLYEYLLTYLINNEFLINIKKEYLYLADTFFCLPIILFCLFIFKNEKVQLRKSEKKIYKLLASVFLLAILFKGIENPIINIDKIINGGVIKFVNKSSAFSSLYLFLLFCNTVIIVPFTEELLFRKVMLSHFNNSNIKIGIVLSSILFTLIHYDMNVFSPKLVVMFLFGIVASLVYLKYGLLYSFIIHATYNFLWFIINLYSEEYVGFMRYLNFDYEYWLLFLFCLAMFLLLLKRLNLFPLFIHSTIKSE